MRLNERRDVAMGEEQPAVYLIDDDASVREGIADLLRSVGHRVQSFESAQTFLDNTSPDAAGCIVLDVRLPGPSGLEVQRALIQRKIRLPIIFITGHGDIPMTVRAMKSGAIELLTKPVHEQRLLDAVQEGLERDRNSRKEAEFVVELQDRLLSLTPREREILMLVVRGLRNKQIAAEAGVSEMTVKVHRSHVMQKMRANSVVELVRMIDQLGLSDQGSGGTIPTA